MPEAPVPGVNWYRFHSETVFRGTSGTLAPPGAAAAVRLMMVAS